MMFNDAHLPEESAWQALTKDLKQAKEARNQLSRENRCVDLLLCNTQFIDDCFHRQLKRSLAQITLQKEEWEKMLKSHNLLQ